MAHLFIQTLKQMVVFLLAGQTILVLGMGKQYEKYLRLLISLMIAANMTAAFGSLMGELPFLNRAEQGNGKEMDFIDRLEENALAFEEELRDRQLQMEERWKKMNQVDPAEGSPTEMGRIRIEDIVVQ